MLIFIPWYQIAGVEQEVKIWDTHTYNLLGSDLWVHHVGGGGGGRDQDPGHDFFCLVVLEWQSIFIFHLGLRT